MGSEISVSRKVQVSNEIVKINTNPDNNSLVSKIKNSSLKELIANRSVESDFTSDRFDALTLMKKIKSNQNTFTLPKTLKKTDKIAFICCNSYEGSKYALGTSAINDGILSYIELEKLGYKVFIFHDIDRTDYMKLFKLFISAGVSKSLVYYIGHGVSKVDTNGDEADGYDECLFFLDGTITDDTLKLAIDKYKVPSLKLVLVTDCCHSGTVYDVEDREDIITLSAAKDNQTAKQDWVERKGQGIFTYYLWKYYGKTVSLGELKRKFDEKFSSYDQEFVTNRTNLNLKDFL